MTCLFGCQSDSDRSGTPPNSSATETTETASVSSDKRLEFQDLALAVQDAHRNRDVDGFAKLIIGRPGQPADVQNHLEIFQADLQRALENVEFVPLADTDSLEYTLNDTVYRPASKPEGWIRLDLRTLENSDSESTEVEVTRMLCGKVHGEWWIIAAAPVTDPQASQDNTAPQP